MRHAAVIVALMILPLGLTQCTRERSATQQDNPEVALGVMDEGVGKGHPCTE